jgi:ankyrin repeat protein
MARLRSYLGVFATLAVMAYASARPEADSVANDLVLIDTATDGDLPRVKTLLASGAGVNARRDNGAATESTKASDDDQMAEVSPVHAANRDLNLKRPHDRTALIEASLNGHLDVVQALLAKNADVNAKTDNGQTALMMASRKGYLEVVQALLAANADVNAKTDTSRTALMMASWIGDLEIVRALLRVSADVDAKDTNGRTALMMASWNGHLAVVRTLLAANADVNTTRDNGATALIMASFNGHPDVVKLLLAANADVNAKWDNGVTELIKASRTVRQKGVQAPHAANVGLPAHASGEPVHVDSIGDDADTRKLSVLSFQRLWNRNHPGDRIAEDGLCGPQTEARLVRAEGEGLATSTDCGEERAGAGHAR